MHISVAEYRIRDTDDAGWAQACEQLAPAFAAVPGPMIKYWLHGDADVRGGVYIWSDRADYSPFSTASWVGGWASIRTSRI